jgi:hypothetical protein
VAGFDGTDIIRFSTGSDFLPGRFNAHHPTIHERTKPYRR